MNGTPAEPDFIAEMRELKKCRCGLFEYLHSGSGHSMAGMARVRGCCHFVGADIDPTVSALPERPRPGQDHPREHA